ncbi:MAG: 30S ribosomal protein S8 [Planctomycetaceae bacterium]|jgi:small subunit ribosomal protein S8|nr:30S ribosomal protein S8 [Planctomycetaceae bacterium]
MMTDPVADMLTRLRNAIRNEAPFVEMPTSRLKVGIAEALKREGYIWEFAEIEASPRNVLRIDLKYGQYGERVIQSVRRVSRPGRRVYSGGKDLPNVLQGLGITLVSTNQGILSNREARAKGIGGEILCELY